jgi:hypothetical protein
MKKNKAILINFSLFFLILVSTVSPVFSAGTGKLKPQASAHTPATVQVPLAKTTFWDLAVDRFIVQGQSFAFANDYNQAKIINVKVGDTVNCQCFYKVQTINLGDITSTDAAHWGTGNFTYKIAGGLFFPGPPSRQEYKIQSRKLPKFTYADVESWKSTLGAGAKKEWNETLVYNWTAKSEHIGKTLYLHFDVDSFFSIKETDEQNNGSFSSSGLVAKFVVTPKILATVKTPVAAPKP